MCDLCIVLSHLKRNRDAALAGAIKEHTFIDPRINATEQPEMAQEETQTPSIDERFAMLRDRIHELQNERDGLYAEIEQRAKIHNSVERELKSERDALKVYIRTLELRQGEQSAKAAQEYIALNNRAMGLEAVVISLAKRVP